VSAEKGFQEKTNASCVQSSEITNALL